MQPYELLELMPLLAELYEEGADRGFLLQPGNNIGYFGPYESLWRGSGDDRVYWTSCNAERTRSGSRPTARSRVVRRCLLLLMPEVTFATGVSKHIWWKTDELSINRGRTSEDLWGFCGSCYYADVCKAGCTWTTHVLFGRAGNNPYCHHRVLELSKQGLRERIAQVEKAPGVPFDHGRFELLLEAADGTSAVDKFPMTGNSLVQIGSLKSSRRKKANGSSQPELIICRSCDRHVFPDTKICPFCHGDVPALAKLHEKKLREARKAYKRLLKLLPIKS